jgi:hypothetical protein
MSHTCLETLRLKEKPHPSKLRAMSERRLHRNHDSGDDLLSEAPTLSAENETRNSPKEGRRHDGGRRLDTWERYRALNDAVEEAYDLIDIANTEARFSLILMGALNAVLFVVATRTDLIGSVPAPIRPWLAVAFAAYGVVGVYFLLHAVETLRPRKFRPRLPVGEGALKDAPLGVRYYEDALKRSAEAHLGAWSELRIGQLNSELAAQHYSLALKNEAKGKALRRVYRGLRLMTLLVAGLLATLTFFVFWATRPV